MLESLEVSQAGPLKNLSIQFSKVNLVIGNNEEGKTTLTDILIHELFRKHKKHGLIKSLSNKRFDLEGKTELKVSPDSEDLSPYASLLVIREGENRWGGSGGHDVEDTAFWNQEIRSVVYGNDAVYTRIQKEIVSLLGVARSNTWLNQFYANLGDFLSIVEEENRYLQGMIEKKDDLSSYHKRLKETNLLLSDMEGAREFTALAAKQDMIEQFFQQESHLEDLVSRRHKLDAMGLDKRLHTWQDLQVQRRDAEQQLVRLKSEQEYLEREKKDLKNREESLHRESVEIKIRLENAEEAEKNLLIEKQSVLQGRAGSSLRNRRRFSTGWLVSLILNFLSAAASFLTGILHTVGIITYSTRWAPVLEPGAFILGGFLLLVFILLLVIILVRSAREWDQGEKEAARIVEDIDNRLSLAREKVRMVKETAASLQQRQAGLDMPGVLKKEEALETKSRRVQEDLEKIRTREKEWLDKNESYENLITIRNEFHSLEKDLNQKRAEQQARAQRIQQEFSTTNKERLHLESKELREKLNAQGEKPVYDEAKYQEALREKDKLIQRIQDIDAAWVELKARVLSRISQARLALGQGVNKERLEGFYQEYLSWDMRDDPYNVTGLVTRTRGLMRRVEQDILYSKTIDQAMKNMDNRLDSLLNSVFQSTNFQSLWQEITLGRYTGVTFEIDKKVNIFVSDRSGEQYPFSSLSTGTRNQFYLVLRMALAERQLSRPGILILDDAFISFDTQRRTAAVEILKNLSSQGWQIFYSTVNETAMEQIFDQVFDKDVWKIELS